MSGPEVRKKVKNTTFRGRMDHQPPVSLSAVAAIALGDVRVYLGSLPPDLYQQPLDILSGSSIGQHTRHIIEFYQCLLEQSADQPTPLINYAHRRRDQRIETEPDYALACVDQICGQLPEVNEAATCRLDCSEHGHDHLETRSTLGRELQYNIEHTIHHLAIIKIALRQMAPDIVLPAQFGVAPSTIRHRQDACAQ